MGGVEYQVTKVDPTDPETKGMVYQVHKVSEEVAATLGGKVYRARIINDPTEPTVAGKVYQIVLIGDPSDPAVKGKVYNAILTGGSEAVVVGPAVSPLNLPDAIANSLSYVKAFGGTEQNGTPTPDAPMDIVSNNGVLRIQGSATGTGTQTGTPTPTTPIYPVFYQKGDLVLRAVDGYADTYDATTQTITRNIGVRIFDGTENFAALSTPNAFRFSFVAPDRGVGTNPMCSHYPAATITLSTANMPDKTIKGNATTANNYYIKDSRFSTEDELKAWLAAQYAAGTPVIIYYALETPITESFTPSVYTDGTVETIKAHGKNLFDKNHLPERIPAYFANSGTTWNYTPPGYSLRFPCKPNTTYTARYNGDSTQAVLSFASTSNDDIPTVTQSQISVTQAIRQNSPTINTPITLTTGPNDKWLIVQYNAAEPQNSDMADNLQIEIGSTATTYAPYYNGGTATAEMLLKVGDYQDVQSILDGVVTRNVGIKVLDGTEIVSKTTSATAPLGYYFGVDTNTPHATSIARGYCSNFTITRNNAGALSDNTFALGSNKRMWFATSKFTEASDFKQWLADQYAAGTPVIVIYPLATPTTESVTGQTLQVQDGDNTLEITQASLTGLELEAQYNAAVSLTIQEVQDANLDNNVTVTIQ